MLKPIENFVKVESQGKFDLWLNRPVYKIYKTERGYVRNMRTGKNMGKQLSLCIRLHDENMRPLRFGIYDEDCYELVEDDNE